MHRLVISQPVAGLALLIALTAPVFANDQYTGTPIAPGVNDRNPVHSSAICGANQIKMSTFFWQTTAPAASIAQWYKHALAGSTLTTAHSPSATTVYAVAASRDRVRVFDVAGHTNLQLAHSAQPIDFNHLPSNCKDNG